MCRDIRNEQVKIKFLWFSQISDKSGACQDQQKLLFVYTQIRRVSDACGYSIGLVEFSGDVYSVVLTGKCGAALVFTAELRYCNQKKSAPTSPQRTGTRVRQMKLLESTPGAFV